MRMRLDLSIQWKLLKKIIVLIFVFLHLSNALAASEGSGVLDGGAPFDPSIIVPNDFDSKINYSYEKIDQYAMNVPPSAEVDIDSLASYLIAPAKNEREKARSIFRWIAENIDYDVADFFGVNPVDSSLEQDVLKSRSSICSGYTDLFSTLAKSAGLEAVRISGYGKGYGYLPGESLRGPTNHAWNAVKINGSWYLIDCTWGAGYIDENKKYVRKLNDHYFMTPPSQFIYDHFPLDPRWQLLNSPISKAEFEKKAYVRSEFFKYGLNLADHLEGTIKSDSKINISIHAPDDVLLIADLRYVERGSSSKIIRNFTFCDRDGNVYDIFARFPMPGVYILNLYAKHEDEPGEYHGVVEYRIDVSAKDIEESGFPMTYGRFTEAGAKLFSPMEEKLKSGTSYRFKIRVPDAKNVSMICGDRWSYLASREDIFEGNLTPIKGDVFIAAKFQNESYDALLKYVGY